MEAAGGLTPGPGGAPLYCKESLGGTNDEAKRLARAGAPHGTAVTARRQTAGKGRLGRSFYSPANAGMYVSVVLRPQIPAEQSLLITSAAAVAAARAIERVSGVEVKIKWVNDLYFTGKKLCGILSEASLSADGRPEFIIVGILPDISEGLSVSLTTAGSLVSMFAFVYAVGTPFTAALAGRFHRFALIISLTVF